MATAAATATGERLGQILIEDGLLTREQLGQALAEQKASKTRLGYVLVKLGLSQELEITKVLARQDRMPAVDLSRFDVDPRILKHIPSDLAMKCIVQIPPPFDAAPSASQPGFHDWSLSRDRTMQRSPSAPPRQAMR